MGKLHEILAVEPGRESVASSLIKQALATFKNKESLFAGKSRILRMFGKTEENSNEMSAIEAKGSTQLLVSATVPETLNYMAVGVADYYDVVLQKELTNQVARASVTIDGKDIIKDAPVTFLLGLETKLKAIREVIAEIPTRAPGKKWIEASDLSPFIYKTEPTKDIKSEKITDYKMLPQPNPNIAVQYATVETTKNVGEYEEVNFSGLITSADKAKLLERIDTLLMEIKKSRQRGNDTETINATAGDNMMAFIFGDWYDRSKRNTETKV